MDDKHNEGKAEGQDAARAEADTRARQGLERSSNQEERERLPFTGNGNQDAYRTAGTTQADPNHADERTSGDESAVKPAPDAAAD